MVEPVSMSIIAIIAAVVAVLNATAGVVKVVSGISDKKLKAEKQNAKTATEKFSEKKLKAEKQNAEAAKGSAEKISEKKLKAENHPSEQNAEAAKGSAEKISEKKLKAENHPSEQNAEAAKADAEIRWPGNESVPMISPGLIPVFDGNDYQTWRQMMMALLKSYDLWDSVENGYDKYKALKNDRKDNLAKLLIMHAVVPSIRHYTDYANTSKEAWDAIQNYYLYNCQDKSRKSYLTNIIADDGTGIARVAIGIILAVIAIFIFKNGQQIGIS